MGWMHDTLRYLGRDPAHRKWHHDDLTFGLLYAFSEKFILPLSHDEVVHGKHSLYERAPGDDWQRFANLRAYFGFMWTHPGKKLLFMGNEIGQKHEWSHDGQIAWESLHDERHAGLQRLIGDLNRIYRSERALHADADPSGFRWIIGDDSAQSVFAYERKVPGAKPIIAIVNMTPVPRWEYRVGVPVAGRWRELINTDSHVYGGSNLGNGTWADSQPRAAHGHAQSLSLLLPPLATLILQPED
jgi:1,4-alpha-glucan branching enzyme